MTSSIFVESGVLVTLLLGIGELWPPAQQDAFVLVDAKSPCSC